MKRKRTHKMGPSLINSVLWLWSILVALTVDGYLYLIGQKWKRNSTVCHPCNSRGICVQYCGSREKTALAGTYRWCLDLEQPSRLIENSIQLSEGIARRSVRALSSQATIRSHQAQDPVKVIATEGLRAKSTWLTPPAGISFNSWAKLHYL